MKLLSLLPAHGIGTSGVDRGEPGESQMALAVANRLYRLLVDRPDNQWNVNILRIDETQPCSRKVKCHFQVADLCVILHAHCADAAVCEDAPEAWRLLAGGKPVYCLTVPVDVDVEAAATGALQQILGLLPSIS